MKPYPPYSLLTLPPRPYTPSWKTNIRELFVRIRGEQATVKIVVLNQKEQKNGQ